MTPPGPEPTSELTQQDGPEIPNNSDIVREDQKTVTNLVMPATIDFLSIEPRLLDDATLTAADTPKVVSTLSSEALKEAVPGYEIVEELGRGGMGVVYLANQKGLNRFVALKMILSGEHAGTGERERFRREAESVAALQHPNIVQIFDIGETGGRPYVALEYVMGGSLLNYLDGQPWPAKSSAQLVEILAKAMQFAHERGIVHRDLKPANVLIHRDSNDGVLKSPLLPQACHPKITDFGLAKRVDPDSSWSDENKSGQHTRTGAVIGTPSYIAPEQAAGKNRDVGPPADVYAIGAILYELLTGRPPFRGETPLDTVLQVMSDDPVPPSKLRAKLPRDLETICLKCLHKDPRKRYRSAGELAEDLRRYLAGEPITARPVSLRERGIKWMRRHKTVTVLGVFISAAVFSLMTLSVYYNVELNEAVDIAHNAERNALKDKQIAEGERVKAEQQKRQADRARADAELARTEAEKKRRESERGVYALQLFKVAAFSDRDPQRGLRMLEDQRRSPEELRDFTWRYLRGLCFIDEQVIGSHMKDERSAPVSHVAHSPDGGRLISTSWDQTAKVWDLAEKKLLFTLIGHQGEVLSAAFSFDGHTLATVGSDNTVRLWDIPVSKPATPLEIKPFATLNDHQESVRAIAFDPITDRMASAGADGKVRLWKVYPHLEGRPRIKPDPLTVLSGHQGPIWALAWSVSGLFSGGQDGTVRRWEPDTGKNEIVLRLRRGVLTLATSIDGEYLAAAADTDGEPAIHLYRPLTGREAGRLRGHIKTIYALSFSPDGKRLASGSRDGTVRMWDVADLRERAIFRPEKDRDNQRMGRVRDEQGPIVRSVSYAPDGRSIVSAGLDGVIRRWDLGGQKEDEYELRVQVPVEAAAMSADRSTLVMTDASRRIKVWRLGAPGSAVSNEPTFSLRGTLQPIRTLTVNENGTIVVAACEDHSLLIWRLMSGRKDEPQPQKISNLNAQSIALQGNNLVVATEEGALNWIDLANPQLKPERIRVLNKVSFVHFSSDGKKLVSVGGPTLQIWDVASRQLQFFKLFVRRPITSLVMTPGQAPDSWMLATADVRGEVKVWSVHTNHVQAYQLFSQSLEVKEEATLTTLNDPVRSLDFTADGKTLVTGGEDRVVRLWDPETGQERAALSGHTDRVLIAAFRQDVSLLTLGREGIIRIWRAER
jgi:WD40 repeat protein/serine/threonine protein kinase